MNWTQGNYVVSDEKKRLKVSRIAAIMKQGFWCAGYTKGKIARLVQNSFWIGLYFRGQLVGFTRVITDKETVTTILDFMIHKAHQGQGNGTFLMTCLIEHPYLKNTSMSLGTQTADHFFEKFGFERNGSMMHRWPVSSSHGLFIVPRVGSPPKEKRSA
jgi:GNAT superfamily N-acetyltransferase